MKLIAFIAAMMFFSIGHAASLESCKMRSESSGASFGPQESVLNVAEIEQSKELIEACPENLRINSVVATRGYKRIDVLRIQSKVTENGKGSRCIYSNSGGNWTLSVTCILK
jgi:hypothetical protein